ncbi:hypothetical protein H0A36_24195 [Endozoicomonas sp. SM1973]|uniref:Uncharacterized protein n=1 Tax=Spartinivicinus marinus TaxID=2994442 RepID=A0A853IJ64_9GAMM|nr:hypothetical protein [Spartinivicinus marinus]NYZ69125.1 hypothetical protein [Spartinivicinus marinus]
MEVVLEGAEGLHKAGLMNDSKLEEFKKLVLKNPEVKKEYDRLGKEFLTIHLKQLASTPDESFVHTSPEDIKARVRRMQYKGFQGSVEYSADDELLYGEVLSIEPLINYEGSTLDELKAAFEAAIDDYLSS